MTITFNSIPTNVRTPGAYLEFDGSKAIQGLPASPQKILIIGQRLAAGTVAALTPTLVVSDAQAVQAFGRGSQLAAMCIALRRTNTYTETWALPVADNGAGVAASCTITAGGTATAAGSIPLMIAGQRVPVAIASGDDDAAVAAKIEAAIDAALDLPVTAGVADEVVTLTARNKGTAGNDIDVRVNYYQGEALPAGVTLTITAMANGATNPTMAQVFAAIGDTQFQTIVLPFTDTITLDAIDAELESRAGPMRAIEGMAYAAFRGSVGSAASAGSARNGKFVSILAMKAGPMPSYEIAAAYAGVIAYNGAIDPARPFQTLPLPGILPPKLADRYTQSEREQLLRDGMSTFTVDAGGQVLIERAITTYQLNAQSLDDIAWLDVNTPLTLFYIRLAVRSRIASKFPRHKLASDRANFAAGQAVVTPRIIRAELIALMRDLERAGLVENLDQFIADLVVERDPNDPSRVNALIPPDIVNQFRVLAGRVEFRL